MKTRKEHEAEAEAMLDKLNKQEDSGDILYQRFLMTTQGKIVDLLLDIHEMLDNRLPNTKEGKP